MEQTSLCFQTIPESVPVQQTSKYLIFIWKPGKNREELPESNRTRALKTMKSIIRRNKSAECVLYECNNRQPLNPLSRISKYYYWSDNYKTIKTY